MRGMHGVTARDGLYLRVCVAVVVCLVGTPALADPGRRADAGWDVLHQRSREALASRQPSPTIVVGFTGGLEGQNSQVSGVVRLRRAIDEQFGDSPDVTALAYSNFKWRHAATEVTALVRRQGTEPAIVVYGHSWGAGAIGKFARELEREGIEIALAIYIDAFSIRNPRVPGNVHYAVNLYQRTGVLRGLPLRGKKHLVARAPESTVILGSLRIRPETDHFGWSWNLVQPLLYRHHHRISHDLRIQEYLLGLLAPQQEAADPGAPPPGS
jgi:hypothetical protein